MFLEGIGVGAVIIILLVICGIQFIIRSVMVKETVGTIVETAPFNNGTEMIGIEFKMNNDETYVYRFIGKNGKYIKGQTIRCFYDKRKKFDTQSDFHIDGRAGDLTFGLAYLLISVAVFCLVMKLFISDPLSEEGILIADIIFNVLKDKFVHNI